MTRALAAAVVICASIGCGGRAEPTPPPIAAPVAATPTGARLRITYDVVFDKPIDAAMLASAVDTVRARVHAIPELADATVTTSGTHIIVELPGGTPRALEALHALIPQPHQIAMKVVDDNAAYMRQLFSRVGNERATGAATDPAAIKAGIRGDVDVWRTDASAPMHTDYYLVAADRAAIERYVAELASSDPAFVLPSDRELAFEAVAPTGWRSYYVERAASITRADIAGASVIPDPNTGRAVVIVEFRDRETFRALTTRIVGHKLATIVDGRVTSAPIIEQPITGGRASITIGGTDPAAQQVTADAIAKELNAAALPTPLVELSVERVP